MLCTQRGLGVGDFERVSWAYDGFHVQSLSGSTKPGYGMGWKEGDVIGVAADLEAGTVAFYQNGIPLGVAYDNLRLGSADVGDSLFACISLGGRQSCRVTFLRDKMK